MNAKFQAALAIAGIVLISLLAAVLAELTGGWMVLLLVVASSSCLFALCYAVIYSQLTSWWATRMSLHLELTMITIVLALAGLTVAGAAGAIDMASWGGKALAVGVTALPLTQAWRLWLLIVAERQKRVLQRSGS